VRVVHGSGMGILRKALRQALQQHPHVESVATSAERGRRRGDRGRAKGVMWPWQTREDILNLQFSKSVNEITRYSTGSPQQTASGIVRSSPFCVTILTE
jgi:hypothetical protein